jgi:hypothetical protein
MRVSISQRLVVSLLHGANYDRMESDMIMQTRRNNSSIYNYCACGFHALCKQQEIYRGFCSRGLRDESCGRIHQTGGQPILLTIKKARRGDPPGLSA